MRPQTFLSYLGWTTIQPSGNLTQVFLDANEVLNRGKQCHITIQTALYKLEKADNNYNYDLETAHRRGLLDHGGLGIVLYRLGYKRKFYWQADYIEDKSRKCFGQAEETHKTIQQLHGEYKKSLEAEEARVLDWMVWYTDNMRNPPPELQSLEQKIIDANLKN
jgi:hypothetical protein